MSDLRATPADAMSRGLRVALNVLIILGVFAMHNLLLSSEGANASHHAMSPVSDVVLGAAHHGAADAVVVAQVVAGAGDDMGGSMSDCGGLMALCLAMVLGASAYIVLRKRTLDRVLWQRPPPTDRAFAAVPEFNCRSPLERSSLLRC